MNDKTSRDRVFAIVPAFVVRYLLAIANAGQNGYSSQFYELKKKLLAKYAKQSGERWQEIRKECFGGFDAMGDPRGCRGASCRKCNGSGLYDVRYHCLQRWEWGAYVFYIPTRSTHLKPERIDIFGKIEKKIRDRSSQEAELWLYLVTLQLSTLWLSLRSRCFCRTHWYPMLTLQRFVMWAWIDLAFRKCHDCKRRYWYFLHRDWLCKKCRKIERDTVDFRKNFDDDEDYPF